MLNVGKGGFRPARQTTGAREQTRQDRGGTRMSRIGNKGYEATHPVRAAHTGLVQSLARGAVAAFSVANRAETNASPHPRP